MRVLVVDDESDVTLVLGAALRDRGHVVAVATCGHEALEVAVWFQPEVALLDVGLPDIDGVTLAELVRGSVRHRLRVVAFSGYSEARLRPAIRRDVFDDFVRKPATLDQIEQAMAPAGPGAHP
jgi:CheY-like chemotaxis protein